MTVDIKSLRLVDIKCWHYHRDRKKAWDCQPWPTVLKWDSHTHTYRSPWLATESQPCETHSLGPSLLCASCTQTRFNTNGTLPYVDRHRTMDRLFSRLNQLVLRSECQKVQHTCYIEKVGGILHFLRHPESRTVVSAHNPSIQKEEAEGSGIQIHL